MLALIGRVCLVNLFGQKQTVKLCCLMIATKKLLDMRFGSKLNIYTECWILRVFQNELTGALQQYSSFCTFCVITLLVGRAAQGASKIQEMLAHHILVRSDENSATSCCAAQCVQNAQLGTVVAL